MEILFGDRIDEEGKSRMRAAEENHPSPVDAAGSEVAGIEITGGKRKDLMMTDTPLIGSPLKRICCSPFEHPSTSSEYSSAPTEDSSDEPLLVPADDLHHPPQIQKAGQINQYIDGGVVPKVDIVSDPLSDIESDIESDSDSDSQSYAYSDPDEADRADMLRICRILRSKKMIKGRNPTNEEWYKFEKQIQDSRGFDVEFCFRIHRFTPGVLTCWGSRAMASTYKEFKYLMDLAANHLGSKEQLKDLHLVKVNCLPLGLTVEKYITFIGTGSSDDVARCYQAKVTHIHGPNRGHRDCTVHFVWLKDERGHLTGEDIRKCCDVDSIRQLYMDQFCPIQLLNQDVTKMVCRERFKHFVLLAADKASVDLDLGGKKLKDLELVEAYMQLFGLTEHHYITFKGTLDGECRFYGAKVINSHNSETLESLKHSVESVWSRDDPIHPTVEERIKNRKVKEVRKCFDVDTRSTNMEIQGVITPVDPETIRGEGYKHEMEPIIIAGAKNCGLEEKLEDLEIEKANMQCYGHTKHHYITFTAKGSLDGECRHYRAKVTTGATHYRCEDKPLPPKCEFVWLEDDQVTN